MYRAFVPATRRADTHAIAPAARFEGLIRPAVIELPGRAVYPHSVIRGGVYDERELGIALASDRVAARHYEGFDTLRARPELLARDRKVYVSYRVKDRIYWSRRMVTLREGETLLTDGSERVRGRCGNRISESARGPVAAFEPPGIDSDTPEFPEPPLITPEFRPGGRGLALQSKLAPEIFPPVATPSAYPGGHEVPPAAYAFIPPWASTATSVPLQAGPVPDLIGEMYQPLPVTPALVTHNWVFQAPPAFVLRPPRGAEPSPEPATIVQLLRPATRSRGISEESNPTDPATPGDPKTPGGSTSPGGSNPPGGSTPPGGSNPPAPPDGPDSPTPPPGPPLVPEEPPPATEVPEPVTGLSALAALALWFAWRAWSRRARARA